MFLIVLILALVASYYGYDILKKWLLVQKYKHIPGPPPDSFFAGNQKQLGPAKGKNEFLEVFIQWVETYGETFKFFIKTRPVIFSIDPDVLRLITTDIINFTKVDHLPNRSLFGQRITGTHSILTGGGQEWAVKRKVMSSFFAKTNMENIFTKCAPLMDRLLNDKLKPRVKNGNTLDLHEQFTMIFSALPGVMGMDCPMGVDEPEEIGRIINIFLDVIPNQLGNLTKVWGSSVSEMKATTVKMVIDLRAMSKTMIKNKKKEMELEGSYDGEGETKDLLDHLIRANYAAGLTDEEVVDDLMTVYLVVDNMSKQLGSLFIHLINHKEIFDKMTTELRENPITDFKSLEKLKYTETVILESLRLAPVLMRGTRWLHKPMQVGPYYIPTDCQFQYSQYVLHRNEQHYENPRLFNPDRFSDDKPAPGQYTFMPFLAGARTCLGKHVAMLTMKLTLSMLARNFDMVPVPVKNKPPQIVTSMAVTRLKNGPFFHFTPVTVN